MEKTKVRKGNDAHPWRRKPKLNCVVALGISITISHLMNSPYQNITTISDSKAYDDVKVDIT